MTVYVIWCNTVYLSGPYSTKCRASVMHFYKIRVFMWWDSNSTCIWGFDLIHFSILTFFYEEPLYWLDCINTDSTRISASAFKFETTKFYERSKLASIWINTYTNETCSCSQTQQKYQMLFKFGSQLAKYQNLTI